MPSSKQKAFAMMIAKKRKGSDKDDKKGYKKGKRDREAQADAIMGKRRY